MYLMMAMKSNCAKLRFMVFVIREYMYMRNEGVQPNTKALTSILSLPTAPSGVLGSLNAV